MNSNPWSYALGLAPLLVISGVKVKTCCGKSTENQSDAQDGIVKVEGKTIRFASNMQ
jgi:hypothetical protein